MNAPLPPGWSAQYEPNQRRYYFIDHKTKKTTWDDPRIPKRPQQTAVKSDELSADEEAKVHPIKSIFPTISDSIIRRTLRNNQGDVAATIDDLLMEGHEMGVNTNQSAESTKSPEKNAVTSIVENIFGPQHQKPNPLSIPIDDADLDQIDRVDESKVKELKALYPSCRDDDFIREVLMRNLGSVDMSKSDIERAGYTKAAERQTVTANPFLVKKLMADFPQVSPDVISEALSSCKNIESVARTKLTTESSASTTTSPAPTTSTTKSTESHGLSSADKHTLLVELCADFQSSSQMVVEMVLETVGYNEESARSVLRTMGPEVKGHRKSVQSKASDKSMSPHKSSSKTDTPSHKAGSKMSTPNKSSGSSGVKGTAVGARGSVSQGSAGRDSASNGTPPSTNNRTNTDIYETLSLAFPQYSRTIIETALQTCEYDEERTRNLLLRDTAPTTSPRKSLTPSPPKTATEMSSPRKSSSRTASSPDDAQIPKPDTFHQSIAKGPNPSLCKGPDTSHLLTDYVQAKGPDRSLHHGPHRDNARGPSKPQGINSNLRSGWETPIEM